MTKKLLIEIKDSAEKVVLAAGLLTTNSENNLKTVTQKKYLDIATRADINVENYIKKTLGAIFLDHNFFAEESGGKLDSEIPTWVIDPIDGTKEFARNIPIFCIAVCLHYKDKPIVSVVYNPRTNELFSAADGVGAYKDGKKVSVTKENKLKKSHLFFRLPDFEVGDRISSILKTYEKLAINSYRVRGIANQNIALCWVGMGGYDGYVNVVRSDNAWDYAPGSLFLEEAGGKLVVFFDEDNNRQYVAANPELCDEIIKILDR